MKLKQPAAPFERLEFHGDSVSLDTEGKVLVLPSGNPDILPNFNEYSPSVERLTDDICGTPGTGSPDIASGAIYTQSEGIFLTDITGNNKTKTFTSNELTQLKCLSLDEAARTITEVFIVQNDNTGTDEIVLCSGQDATGWTTYSGTISNVTVVDDHIVVSGTSNSIGALAIRIPISTVDLSSHRFLQATITANANCSAMITMGSASNQAMQTKINPTSKLSAGVETVITIAFQSPANNKIGSAPYQIIGSPNWESVSFLAVGISGDANTEYSFSFKDVRVCNGNWAQIEVAVPNNLNASKGIAHYSYYEDYASYSNINYIDSPPSNINYIDSSPSNLTTLDGTPFDSMYGESLGRGYYSLGHLNSTPSALGTGIPSLTYTSNVATQYSIGFALLLPPCGSLTGINKCRIKLVISYISDSCVLADSAHPKHGLQNLTKPFIALYDPDKPYIDFFNFTYQPKKIEFKRDSSGTINELTLHPGNGVVYHGRVTHCNPELDSDSNGIPDCLEASVEGSVTKLLQAYTISDPKNTHKIIGIWPNTVNPSLYQPDWSKLTHVIYASWTMNADGSLTPPTNISFFNSVLETAHTNGVKVMPMILSSSANVIDTVLANNSQTLINNILDLLQTTGADGVKIDFEFPSDVNTVSQENNKVLFETFALNLNSALKTENPEYYISLDIDRYIIAPYRNPNLVQYFDDFFLMTYQYNYGSTITRANAPIYDINKFGVDNTVTRALEYYPKDKIIIGIALYGKEFTASADTPGSTIISQVGFPSMQTAMIQAATYGRRWDSASNTPYYVFQDEGVWHQTWYDDDTSILIKLNFSKFMGLGGIGLNALGMEGNNATMWNHL